MIPVRIAIPLYCLVEHDLLRKPVPTFRDHAPRTIDLKLARLQRAQASASPLLISNSLPKFLSRLPPHHCPLKHRQPECQAHNHRGARYRSDSAGIRFLRTVATNATRPSATLCEWIRTAVQMYFYVKCRMRLAARRL